MTNCTNTVRWRADHVAVGSSRCAAKCRKTTSSLRCSARLSTSMRSITTAQSNSLCLAMGTASRAAAKAGYCSPAGGLLLPFQCSSKRGARTVRPSAHSQLSVTAHTSSVSSSQPLTAVVVGSGMAGLATAAALSDYFDKVTVLEADAPKETWHQSLATSEKEPHTRPGVGQYQLLHVLLAKGAAEIDRLVPGYINTLLEKGAVKTDFLTQALFATPAGAFVPVHNSKQPLQMIQASRHLLEQTLRDLVSQNPKTSFSYHSRVEGLLFDGMGASSTSHHTPAAAVESATPSNSSSSSGEQRVTGVKLSDGSVMSADLVVVASGRRGEVAHWLSGAGWPEATVSKANANCRYACWLMQIPPEVSAQVPYNGVYYQMQPPNNDTGAYAQRIEENTWIATIGTFDNKGPRSDMDDVLQYMQQVPYVHDAYELFKQGTVTSSVHTYGALNNTWHHYEKALPPDGLLILGDAYCTFNPIYGQGMTVAALEAGILHSVLKQRRSKATTAAPAAAAAANPSSSSSSSSYAATVPGLAADFYPAATEVVGASWLFAALRDLQFPFATAENQELTWVHRLMLAYTDTLCKVATFDSETSEVFCRAIHMMDLPSAMFRPSLVAKALAHVLLGWPWGSGATQKYKTLALGGNSPGLQNLASQPSFDATGVMIRETQGGLKKSAPTL